MEMKKRQLLVLLLVLFIPLMGFSHEVNVLTEDVPPNSYLDDNGRAAGFCVEIVNEMMDRGNVKITGGRILVLPWARGYAMLQKKKNVILFSTVRTEKRENMFKWVGPIAPRVISLWKLRTRKDIVAHSFSDVRSYTVGAVLGFASTTYMEELGFNLDYTTDEMLNFKKLLAGRFDMLTTHDLAAAYQMRLLGRSFNQLERVIILDDSHAYYIAINKETPDEIVIQLQTALDAMKADGAYEDISQRYLK